MAKRSDTTCSDCYFRQEGLCALATETPCPTFRQTTRGRLAPPRQAQLVPLMGKAHPGHSDVPREREREPQPAAPRRHVFA